MLKITVPATESFDPVTNTFYSTKEQVLSLEHSLVSISKWESKWHKPFLTRDQKTIEESRDYIRCMTLTQNVDPAVYYALTDENYRDISEYMENPMTATTFREERSGSPGREIITAEIVYYWMVALQIPFECQKWHFNKLMTLIRVCNEKNKPPKKMSKKAIMSQQRSLNAARRQRLNSMG